MRVNKRTLFAMFAQSGKVPLPRLGVVRQKFELHTPMALCLHKLGAEVFD